MAGDGTSERVRQRRHEAWVLARVLWVPSVVTFIGLLWFTSDLSCEEATVDGSPGPTHAEWSWVPLGSRCVPPAEHPGPPGWVPTIVAITLVAWAVLMFRFRHVHQTRKRPLGLLT